MLSRILDKLPEGRTRNTAYVVGGMGSLLVGARLPAVGLFGKGVWGLEQHWRTAHPEFEGGLRERWRHAVDFYDQTHQDSTNRVLHVVGIPMIAGGALGLLATKPYNPLWWGSAASFTAGWGLNIVGHVFYERNAPAFADDPLSFFVGPVWDARNLLRRGGGTVDTDQTSVPVNGDKRAAGTA